MPAHCTIILSDRPQDSQVGQAMYHAREALDHLVELRVLPETRDDMAKEEEALWALKSKIELILSSIACGPDVLQAAE